MNRRNFACYRCYGCDCQCSIHVSVQYSELTPDDAPPATPGLDIINLQCEAAKFVSTLQASSVVE